MSEANFVSSRMGQNEERETYKAGQSFFNRHWKIPGFDEELYRAFLSGNIRLPISKFAKFNKPLFTGRRWEFVQPVDDARAMEIHLNNRTRSVSSYIRDAGNNPKRVFAEIERDEETLKKLGIGRLQHLAAPIPDGEPPADGTPTKGDAGKSAKRETPVTNK